MRFCYETDRLVLKVLNEDDADKVLDFYVEGDPYFGRMEPDRSEGFYTWDYQRCILKYELENFLSERGVRFYIFERDNEDDIIGTVSIQNIKRGAFLSGQIGYKLLERCTSKGYCSEAVCCAVKAAFSELGLHKLIAYVQADNIASIKVLERAGFEQEGIARDYARLHGGWQDHLVYSCIEQ